MNAYTKKAPAPILSLAQSYRPTLPKTSSINECFEVIADENDIELDVSATLNEVQVRVYKDNSPITDMSWPKEKMFDDKEGDWRWNELLSAVIIECSKKKLLRKVRRNKKTGEVIISKKEQKRLATPTFTPEQKDEYKKCKQSLKNREKGTGPKTPKQLAKIQELKDRISELEKIGLENTRKGMGR